MRALEDSLDHQLSREAGMRGGQEGTGRNPGGREESGITARRRRPEDGLPPARQERAGPPSPEPGRLHLVEPRRLFTSESPSTVSTFTFPGGRRRPSLPPSLRNAGPRPGPRGPRIPPPPPPGARCLHLALRPDPVSKSPESHFLPRPPLPAPLPGNLLELAFTWSSFFFFFVGGGRRGVRLFCV